MLLAIDYADNDTKALRSNFEPGSPREAVRRAQWKALGLTDDDMLKPKIAVVNSSSELAICFSHLDGIAKVVKEAVREAGGLPFEIRTAAPSDFIISAGAGGGYMLASRDLIVNDMEIAVEGAQLDGMICLSSCDKTPPAHLMAAGRFNIPTILVICGYQPSGHYEGKHVDIEDVFIGSVQAMFGKLSKETLAGMCDHAITGPGVCAGMGTANSMHIVCEALGMTLPGAAPVLANSPKMFDIARQSGRRIVEMVWEDLKPRDDPDAGRVPQRRGRRCWPSAARSTASSTCRRPRSKPASTSTCSRSFNELGEQVPVLSAVAPNGPDTIDAFEAAGGARALLKQLEPLLDRDGAHGHRPHDGREPRRRRRSPTRTSSGRSTARSARQASDRRAARIAGARERDRQARPARRPAAAAIHRDRDRVRRCAGGDRGQCRRAS